MTPDEMMKLAEKIYEGLSDEEIEEIEKVMLDRSNFFNKNPNRIFELIDGINEENMQKAIDFGKCVGRETVE